MLFTIDPTAIFSFKKEGPVFYCFLALQQDLSLDIKGVGPLHIREKQYNIVYVSNVDNIHFTEKKLHAVILCLQYELALLEHWENYFPILDVFIEECKSERSTLLLADNGWITRTIQETTQVLQQNSLNAL